MGIGLGQIQHAVPLNRVLAELTKGAAPDFMVAVQAVEDCGEVPDILGLAEQIVDMAQDAKQFGKLRDDPLTAQGIAFMMLYSAEGTTPAFYKVLNELCYDPDRSKIVPFGQYVVGAVKHMKRIEAYPNSVVLRGVKADLEAEYPLGREVVWHGFCSTTKSIGVLSNPMFCGKVGKRTIFQITLTQGQAREITRYSLVAAEDEVLLPPGCRFKVESVLPQGDLTIIQMTELPSKAWIMDLTAPDEPEPQPATSALGMPPTMPAARPKAEAQARAVALAALPSATATDAATILQQHMLDGQVVAEACGVLASLMHGSDTRKQAVADAGGAASIVAAMRGHSGSAAVQENGCKALKNLTFGGQACLAAIRGVGAAKSTLQTAISTHPTAAEDAQFVLRKL